MKQLFSNCCEEHDEPIFGDHMLYSEKGICPRCKEHCEFDEIEVDEQSESEWIEEMISDSESLRG